MNKEKYLDESVVKEFIEYLSSLIKGKELNHFYIIKNNAWKEFNVKWRNHNNITSGNSSHWVCKTLEDAFKQFYWKGRSYKSTKSELEGYKQRLDSSLEEGSKDTFIAVCNDVLRWGGVENNNTQWLRTLKDPIELFKKAKEHLNGDESCNPGIRNDEWSILWRDNYRMNAGFTKIFSLICDNFIIYDSRVGAALGKILVLFLKSKKINNKTIQELNYDFLDFRIPTDRSSANRNPSVVLGTVPGVKFTMLTGARDQGHNYALWNQRANWILESAVEKSFASNEDIKWKYSEKIILKNEMMKAIECALFMIGYDLPGRYEPIQTPVNSNNVPV